MGKRHHIPIDPNQWFKDLEAVRGETEVLPLKRALALYPDSTAPALQKGLAIADILLALKLDGETLAACIAYAGVQNYDIHLDQISEVLGESARKMLRDVMQMQSLGKWQHLQARGQHHHENLRKMLLAMVKDVRAVLVILAERLWQLRQAKNLDQMAQQKLAQETMDVYAPLANRLGIWQLKWEIEDLSLRYLQPDIYMQVAKWLANRRDERESYIQNMIATLKEILNQSQLPQYEVSGRVKHIYSIYKKMQRKNATIENIYDISALRVLVPTIDDCYKVLSILQEHWHHLHDEFDDYISNPKPNGYRSIHAVIVDSQGKMVEVQIRTYEMHQESELGVAAHWHYKEGVLHTDDYQAKIALLRQVMAWQAEMSSEIANESKNIDLLADQVYVFTPLGDIIDLAKGATPLDFAYHVHSEVGHRCKGAKVNGVMVPLTYELQTGERVEILTAKEPHPSRDWLNPHYGYLKTSRARAKVQHWFRLKDAVEPEKVSQVIAESKTSLSPLAIEEKSHTARANIQAFGIKNLLTHLAKCCKPLPGDQVIGYITRARGVTIHRKNCLSLKNAAIEPNKLIEINWGDVRTTKYTADLMLRIQDRPGLLRDISGLLAAEKIEISGIRTQKIPKSTEFYLFLSVEVEDREKLHKVIELLKNLPDIVELHRQ